MFRNNLESIEGVAIYPMFSLLVFVIFFAIVFVWAARSDKKHMEEMSRVPLANNDESTNKSQESYE
jgi:cbb3-type cytochrome oxidase subunit 3